MSRRIIPITEFNRRAKRLFKKFRSLPDELQELMATLAAQPTAGRSLGGGLYKIRLGSASKGGGKSGGFRIITYYVEPTADADIVYLVTIYDKSEEASMAKDDLLAQVRGGLPE